MSGLDREFGEPVGGREAKPPRRFKRPKRGKGKSKSCWDAQTSRETPGIGKLKSVPRDAPLRPGDQPGRMPGDRPVRHDDVYETDVDAKNREFREWTAKRCQPKLTEDDVRAIRALASNDGRSGDETRKDIARRFGVHHSIIYEVMRGRMHKNVKDKP